MRDLVHVEDIAAATIRALVAPRAHNETVNVGTGIPTSIRQVAELVARHYPGTQLIEAPMPPGDPLGGYAGTHRARSVLEWRPTVSIADGVERYVHWLEKTPEATPPWLREENEGAPAVR